MASRFGMVLALLLCMASASALTINVPSEDEELFSPVLVHITANETQDVLSFVLNSTNGSCMNCSELQQAVPLGPGAYTLVATADLGNVTRSASVTFTVLEPEPFTILLHAPENTTYTDEVPVRVTTSENATLTYQFSGAATDDACDQCDVFNTTWELDAGTYTVTFSATTDNASANATVSFTVREPDVAAPLALTVSSPKNRSYEETVPVLVTMNKESALTYRFAGENWTDACTQCATFITEWHRDPGAYTVTFSATADDETVQTTVSFSMTEEEDSAGPPFSLGLQKLPQEVADGKYTDAELAEIIREHQLNPGIVNRLVKTGKLGNASIDAIIETQRTPPGIFQKVLGFFGIVLKTPKESLLDQYDLTPQQQERLVEQPDVQPKVREQVRERLAAVQAPGLQKQAERARAQESGAGNSGNVPPGLAKK